MTSLNVTAGGTDSYRIAVLHCVVSTVTIECYDLKTRGSKCEGGASSRHCFKVRYTLYGAVYTLRCGIHFMVRNTLYGAVYTLRGGIHFMVRYTLYGAVYTLWCGIHFTGRYTLYGSRIHNKRQYNRSKHNFTVAAACFGCVKKPSTGSVYQNCNKNITYSCNNIYSYKWLG